MSDLVPGVSYKQFVAEAARHRTEAAFRASAFFERHGGAIDTLLRTPVVHRFRGGAGQGEAGFARGEAAGAGRDEGAVAAPDEAAVAGRGGPGARETRPLRIVHWNIEKGKKLAGISEFLRSDRRVAGADLICLNEVDDGMARTGNADVTRELARGLGCDGIYLPNYIECTKGLPRERLAPGENARGLHGIAILSRLPIRDVRVEPLPPCWDYFDYPEKRFGGRRGLYVRVGRGGDAGRGDAGGGPADIVVATTHLEMRCAPPCRARQFAAFLAGLSRIEAEWGRRPAIITGDWNTHTFRRGGRLAAAIEYFRIVGTPRSRLDRDLVRPLRLEPLFRSLDQAGFTITSTNDQSTTASQALDTVEDLALLPDWLGRGVVHLSGLKARVLRMRLDWIAIRDLRAAAPPFTLFPIGADGEPLSDHALIAAEVE